MLSCQGCGQETSNRLCCPICSKLGRVSFFCSQECFKKSWPLHNRLHKIMKESKVGRGYATSLFTVEDETSADSSYSNSATANRNIEQQYSIRPFQFTTHDGESSGSKPSYPMNSSESFRNQNQNQTSMESYNLAIHLQDTSTGPPSYHSSSPNSPGDSTSTIPNYVIFRGTQLSQIHESDSIRSKSGINGVLSISDPKFSTDVQHVVSQDFRNVSPTALDDSSTSPTVIGSRQFDESGQADSLFNNSAIFAKLTTGKGTVDLSQDGESERSYLFTGNQGGVPKTNNDKHHSVRFNFPESSPRRTSQGQSGGWMSFLPSIVVTILTCVKLVIAPIRRHVPWKYRFRKVKQMCDNGRFVLFISCVIGLMLTAWVTMSTHEIKNLDLANKSSADNQDKLLHSLSTSNLSPDVQENLIRQIPVVTGDRVINDDLKANIVSYEGLSNEVKIKQSNDPEPVSASNHKPQSEEIDNETLDQNRNQDMSVTTNGSVAEPPKGGKSESLKVGVVRSERENLVEVEQPENQDEKVEEALESSNSVFEKNKRSSKIREKRAVKNAAGEAAAVSGIVKKIGEILQKKDDTVHPPGVKVGRKVIKENNTSMMNASNKTTLQTHAPLRLHKSYEHEKVNEIMKVEELSGKLKEAKPYNRNVIGALSSTT